MTISINSAARRRKRRYQHDRRKTSEAPARRPEVSDDERLVQRSLRMTAEQWRIFDAHGGSHGYVSRWTRAQESSLQPLRPEQDVERDEAEEREQGNPAQEAVPVDARFFFRHAASAALVDHIDLLFNEALAIFQMLHLAVV